MRAKSSTGRIWYETGPVHVRFSIPLNFYILVSVHCQWHLQRMIRTRSCSTWASETCKYARLLNMLGVRNSARFCGTGMTSFISQGLSCSKLSRPERSACCLPWFDIWDDTDTGVTTIISVVEYIIHYTNLPCIMVYAAQTPMLMDKTLRGVAVAPYHVRIFMDPLPRNCRPRRRRLEWNMRRWIFDMRYRLYSLCLTWQYSLSIILR